MDVREAFSAGWKATAKVNAQKKQRGWKGGGSADPATCSYKIQVDAKFCGGCGKKKSKRGWLIVGEKDRVVDSDGDAARIPPPEVQPPRPMNDLRSSYSMPRSVLGKAGPGAVSLSPTEMIGALDQMSKGDKKALKQMLQEEEDALAWKILDTQRPFLTSTTLAAMASVDRSSSSRNDDQLPMRPHQTVIPPSKKDEYGRDKAKAVRQKELDDFRKGLYEKNVDGHRCIPSTAAPTPNEIQARCKHEFKDLLWTSNTHGHFARCKRCDLQHVLYWRRLHGCGTKRHVRTWRRLAGHLRLPRGGAEPEESRPSFASMWTMGFWWSSLPPV